MYPSCSSRHFELVAATVHVADDVERSAVLLPVVPEWLALDDSRIDFVLRLEHVDVAEALASEPAKRPVQLAPLVSDDMRPEVPVRSRSIAFVADALWQIENHRDRQNVILAGQRHKRLACLRLDVRRIDDRELGPGEPTGRHEMQRRERIIGRRLVVLVVRHERTEGVRRHDLRRLEMPLRERRLATPGRSNQNHQGELGNRQRHPWSSRPIPALPSLGTFRLR